ncbi:MAG: prepilin-type N-terminal cleavage/methylation domain-containing protein [Clostridia bacterium]|nr:prepilin-type N-terminal cleavage/methylation domain-containing protein [Clostridia bacterium]
MKRTKRSARRGITLVETVISIAIVAIASAAVLTAVSAQAKIRKSALETLHATSIAENVIECFVFSKDENEFTETLKKVLDVAEISPESTDVRGYELKIETNGTSITVTVSKSDKIIVDALTYQPRE